MSSSIADRWPLPAEDIPDLPVDELAIRLLRHINGTQNGSMSRANCTYPDFYRDAGPGYDCLHVRRAIGEAFDWLRFQGLIAEKPNNDDRWLYVTARGQAAAQDQHAVRTLRAEKRIDLDLHPRLASRVRRQFLLGEYEAAVLLAFREVEIRVRDLGELDASQIGVPLMQQAFSPKGGPLLDSNLDAGEQQATMNLFAGAIGAFKNPSSHRQVDYGDVTVASEAVLLADLLMRILDRYEPPSQP